MMIAVSGVILGFFLFVYFRLLARFGHRKLSHPRFTALVLLLMVGCGAAWVGVFLIRDWIIGPLRSEQSPVRRVEIARQLGAARDSSAVRHLMRALSEDTDARVRAASACALGEIRDERLTSLLVEKVGQRAETADVKICALKSLRQLGDGTAVPELIRLMGESSGALRVEVVHTLGVLRDPRALQPLMQILRDPNANDELDEAEHVVALLGEVALTDIRKLYLKGQQATAINVLLYMGQPGVADLLEVFRTASGRIRAQAVRGLLLGGDADGIAAMRTEMTINLNLVAEAHEALIELGDSSFIPLLVRALNTRVDVGLDEDLLNSGDPTLEAAAQRWAREHGYEVTHSYGRSGRATWGRR